MDFSQLNLDSIVLVVASLLFIVLIFYWHTKPEVNFDIKEMFLHNDRVSLSKFGQFVALVASTWVLIVEVRSGRLSEWLFSMYMISWAGANLVNKYLDQKGAAIAAQLPPNEPAETGDAPPTLKKTYVR